MFSCKWILYSFYRLHVAVSSWPVTSGPKLDSNLALNESRNDGRPVLWLMSFYSLFTDLHFSFKISVDFFFFLPLQNLQILLLDIVLLFTLFPSMSCLVCL